MNYSNDCFTFKFVFKKIRFSRFQYADRKKASTLREVTEALNLAIDRLEEGLVLKDPESVYKPNVRNNQMKF